MWFRLCNLALIIVLLVTSGTPSLLHAAPAAAPPRQDMPGLCDRFLPEPFPGSAKPWGNVENTADKCAASQVLNGDDGHQAWAIFNMLLFPDRDSAAAALESVKISSLVEPGRFQASNRYGDSGYYGIQQTDANSFTEVDVAFVYGCYFVDVNASIDPASHLSPDFASTTYAGYVAQALKAGPRCPGEESAPTKALHTVGLGCATGNAPNTIRCTAAVHDTLPGANIVYRWTVNGKEQAGVTGAGLTVEDLAPGDYTVSVTAIDQAHGNAASPPASFVMTVAGGPAPAGSAGFKVRLNCTVSDLPDRSRQVGCMAAAENPPAGANLKYAWSWNGVPDYMQAGATFQYRGMSSGSNTISVDAFDVASRSRSETASTTIDVPRLDGSPATGNDDVPTLEELQPEVHGIVIGLSPDVKKIGDDMLKHFFDNAPDGHDVKTDPDGAKLFAYATALALATSPVDRHPLYPSVLLAMPQLEQELWQVMLGTIPLSTVEQHFGLLVAMDKLLW